MDFVNARCVNKHIKSEWVSIKIAYVSKHLTLFHNVQTTNLS